MSTRSGKKIHISLEDDTVKSVADINKSERRTRSKHTKENLNELHESPKLKKRNYVAYPGDDDCAVDTVDSKDERTTRALRKNALKERNITSFTDTVDSVKDSKLPVASTQLVRSIRRTRKFAENSEQATELVPQDEELTKVELPKHKKEKKKKKAKQQEEITKGIKKAEEDQMKQIEVVIPKKKSKKKKGRKTNSIVVEDIEPEAATNLNKSNMSVDSFHSAASSPRNMEVFDDPILQMDIKQITESRKTRSSSKLDNTLINNNEKKPRKRKSSIKVNHNGLDQVTVDVEKKSPMRGLSKRKSSISNIASVSVEDTKNESKDSTYDNTPKISTTFDKDTKDSSAKHNKRKCIADDVDNDFEIVDKKTVNTTFEMDVVTESEHKKKKRGSAVNVMVKITDKLSPLKSTSKVGKKKSVLHDTDQDAEINKSNDIRKSITDAIFNTTNHSSPFNASPVKLFKQEAKKSFINTTFDKESESTSELETEEKKMTIVNATFDLTSSPFQSGNEVSSPVEIIELKKKDDLKRKSIINTTYEKDSDADQETMKDKSPVNTTFDKDGTESKINTTFEKVVTLQPEIVEVKKRGSLLRISQKVTDINHSYDIDSEKKLDTTFDKNSKSSLISSDNSTISLDKSNASRFSITSDESKTEENILNTTPVLIESSMDDSQINVAPTPKETSPKNNKTQTKAPVTPLKREGTFTKEEPEVVGSPKRSLSKTPSKRMSLPSPGFTPFHMNKSSSKEKSVMNVTRSIEKRRSSLAEPPRMTKVMFCSPMNNPAAITQNRRKVIKSNLKGSNKSFIFDDSVVESRPGGRKRSYTQSDAEDARVKRKRLADELQQSVDRLSRPRTSSASAKLAEPTTPSKKSVTPSKRSDAKISRTKLPNFAVMHQRRFDKMESLDECQERKAKRAKQLLTPNGAVDMLERISPKDKAADQEKSSDKSKEAPKKPETPIKSLPTFKSLNPGYTRFGFKLNLDVNPFSIPSKTQTKPKENKPNVLTRQATLPSLAGATSVRREVAKQTVMREKSFTERRSVKRTENRTVIKGVRTNRRFELQMRMRDL